jgi:hypothetical protein
LVHTGEFTPFSPLSRKVRFDETGDNVAVVLSPEAEAFFRAWLRRQQIWRDGGLNTVHAWSN